MREKPDLSCSDLNELASSYVLGALDPDLKEAFDEHLRAGCKTCETELRSYEKLAAELVESVAQEPPASVRERLFAKVAQVPRAPGVILDRGGIVVYRPDEIAWTPLAPGIEVKLLSKESERRYNTCLVKMDAGARYPRHRHGDVEELFLLSGDLHLAGDMMRPGDYCRAEAETIHDESYTEAGCVFLVRSSRNEMLA